MRQIDLLINNIKELKDYSLACEMSIGSDYWKGQYDAFCCVISMLKSADYKCQCGSPLDENGHCIVLKNKDRVEND